MSGLAEAKDARAAMASASGVNIFCVQLKLQDGMRELDADDDAEIAEMRICFIAAHGNTQPPRRYKTEH